jgi:hypothetical protein
MRSSILLTTILLSGLSGCVTDSGQTLLILRDQLPGQNCTIKAGTGGEFISVGQIDTNADTGYIFTPVIQNQAQVPAKNEQGTNIAFIEGAEVQVEFLDPNLFGAGEITTIESQNLTAFTVPFGGTIFPGGTTGFALEVIPYDLLQELGNTLVEDDQTNVVVRVKFFGKLDGGTVESQTWAHNIKVCNGCMTEDLGLCIDLATGYFGSPGGKCNELQDFVLECCETETGTRCPAASGP